MATQSQIASIAALPLNSLERGNSLEGCARASLAVPIFRKTPIVARFLIPVFQYDWILRNDSHRAPATYTAVNIEEAGVQDAFLALRTVLAEDSLESVFKVELAAGEFRPRLPKERKILAGFHRRDRGKESAQAPAALPERLRTGMAT